MWIKRATGIGYKQFPELPEGEVHRAKEMVKKLEDRPREMVDRIIALDRELRRRGLRPIQNAWRR